MFRLNCIFLVFIFIMPAIPLNADVHKKSEIQTVLDDLDMKILRLNNEDNIEDHKKEVASVKDFYDDAKKSFSKRKYDMAYYQAQMALEYIALIYARIKLMNAKAVYEKTKAGNGK